MTNIQKTLVDKLRLEGLGYLKIAQEIDVSENTVKSYCRRNKSDNKIQVKISTCEQCGKPIDKNKRSIRRFCSDTCRTKWWNKHPKVKIPYTAVCNFCGKEINMRRRNEKKYCSHACYINARYGDGND